jgi:hypothetical protein
MNGKNKGSNMIPINYEAFAKAILEYDYCSYDLDGGTIQELGVKHGLLIEVETKGVCLETESCNCLTTIGEIPDTCFKFTYKN